ncbi:hypothetical protein [Actinoplanes sp. NPDC026670]|uniref:hypothetical protein n=1 Tax=Actinoplanes sp. NPDC026670 TaxID=3154700 RepID=UPI003402EACB
MSGLGIGHTLLSGSGDGGYQAGGAPPGSRGTARARRTGWDRPRRAEQRTAPDDVITDDL